MGRPVFPEMSILEYKACFLAANQVFISASSPLVPRELAGRDGGFGNGMQPAGHSPHPARM